MGRSIAPPILGSPPSPRRPPRHPRGGALGPRARGAQDVVCGVLAGDHQPDPAHRRRGAVPGALRAKRAVASAGSLVVDRGRGAGRRLRPLQLRGPADHGGRGGARDQRGGRGDDRAGDLAARGAPHGAARDRIAGHARRGGLRGHRGRFSPGSRGERARRREPARHARGDLLVDLRRRAAQGRARGEPFPPAHANLLRRGADDAAMPSCRARSGPGGTCPRSCSAR
jgi:hypothetical protein